MDETIQRASGAGETLGRVDRERKIQEARELIASGSWRDAVKEYGQRVLVNPYIPPASLERIVAQLSAIDMVVPDDVLEASRGNKNLVRLLSATRGSMLVRIAEAMGTTAWEKMLRGSSDAYSEMSVISQATDLSRDTPEFINRLLAQPSVEVDGSGDEGTSADTREFLKKTGFFEIARRVSTIIRTEPIRGNRAASGGYETSTGQLIVRSEPEYRRYIPGIVLHESGHGLNTLLAGVERGQEWFERYAADAMLRPEAASSYAESFVKSDEAIWGFKNGRVGDTFVRESFAEDFARYWLDQDAVAKERRQIFDEIADEIFPDVDREELRVRIRQYLRQKYGMAPSDIVHPRDCETTERMADERIAEARKRAEEYVARQAAKTNA